MHRIYEGSTADLNNWARKTEASLLTSGTHAQLATEKTYNYLNNSGDIAETKLEYNQYGYVTRIQSPFETGTRPERNFSYDANYGQYLTEVTNHLGEKSTYRYNELKQMVIQSVDVNGHPTRYYIDNFKRIIEIWAPREVYEQSTGPTISFVFYPEGYTGSGSGAMPSAITYHNTGAKQVTVTTRDNTDLDYYRTNLVPSLHRQKNMPSSVKTATLTDGFDRVIQVQTEVDLDVNGGSQVNQRRYRISGHSATNILGDPTVQRNDFIETTHTLGLLVVRNNDVISETVKVDVLGRIKEQHSIWSDPSDDGIEESSYVGVKYNYEWKNGLSNHSGFYFTTEAFSEDLVDGIANLSRQYIDSRGRTIAQESADDIITEFEYDDLGQLVKVIDPLNLQTTYSYDNFGRPVQEVHHTRGTTTTSYDILGNIESTNWAGEVTNFTYDTYQRLSQKTFATANSGNLYNVEFEYGASDGSDGINAVGRIKKVTQGNPTAGVFLTDEFEYDELGQTHRTKRTMNIPGSGNRTFNTYSYYDSFGRALRLVYPDDEQVNYFYSNRGSLEKIQTQLPSQATRDVITQITYDGFGNVGYILYGNGSETTFDYHANTRALEATSTTAFESAVSSFSQAQSREYSYNKLGLINHQELFANDRLVPYVGTGHIVNTHDISYSYDNNNRLTSSTYEFENTPMYTVTTNYNAAGGITDKTSDVLNSSDGLMQNASIDYNNHYNYLGHKLESVDNGSSVQKYFFATNAQGSVTSKKYWNAFTQSYDASKEETYIWNADQQLVAVENENTIQHYVYDYTGTRVLKTDLTQSSVSVDDNLISNTSIADPYKVYVNEYFVETTFSNGAQTTKHYYMGMQRVTSDITLQEIQQGQGSAKQEGPNPVMDDFKGVMSQLGYEDGEDYNSSELFDANTLELLYPEYVNTHNEANKSTGAQCCFSDLRYWYHPDYLGSVSMITNEAGEVHQYFMYNAWGESMYSYTKTPDFDSEFHFNGKEYDDATGFAYYGARYYDNELSIWLSVDPLANQMPSWSPYSFSFNNPIKFVDPDGNKPIVPGDDELVLPSDPDDLDGKTWIRSQPDNVPEGRGHSRYYKHAEQNLWLAYDEVVDDPHYHLYEGNADGGIGTRRYNADGDLLPKHLKSTKRTHFKAGSVLKVGRAIQNIGGAVFIFFDILAIFTDSPQNPLYMYLEVGGGEQNRAYIDSETMQIYEWSEVEGDSEMRELRTYRDYEKIDGEWRGVDLIRTQYFNKEGREVERYEEFG